MKNRIIAAVTAIALTLSSAAATPAMAQDRGNDALKVLLGAAAIGLLLNQVNKNKQDDKKQVTRNTHYTHWQPNRNYGQDKRRIPPQCVFSVRGHDVVSARCLEEFRAARNMPSSCAFVINTSWGRRTVYGSRCLRDRGFIVAGRR
jgi:hypothetical protein